MINHNHKVNIELEGTLTLPDEGYDFYVGDTNISEILNKIYTTEPYAAYISIYANAKKLFEEEGVLDIRENEKIYGYHLDDVNLDEVLFNNTGNRVNIIIKEIGEQTNHEKYKAS
jgi:hypothetical protein